MSYSVNSLKGGYVGVNIGDYYKGYILRKYQDLPCTLDWGYMVPNSGYLGPNRG